MRAARHRRRRPVRGVPGALLTTGLLTAALIATALLAASAAAPATLTRVTSDGASPRIVSPGASPAGIASPGTGASAGAHRAGHPETAGWRLAAAVGPENQGVAGALAARSARDAWAVWTGRHFTAVQRLTPAGWQRVPLPARFAAYVRSAVAFDGGPATDFWLFSSYRTTRALRFTGTRWALAAIPSWVLRAPSGGGTPRAVAAVFGPDDVWVFSLDAGRYAARYDGRSWSKVRLPGVPDEVNAVAGDDIWALTARGALRWDGRTWATVRLPAAAGEPVRDFSHLTAAGPRSAWVWRDPRVARGTGPGATAGAGASPATDVLHWNGARWQRVAGTPADLVSSVAPDGAGGLWASGLDRNPGGFSFLYHLTGGRWQQVTPPAGVWAQQPEQLTWVPGTRSLWGTAVGGSAQGSDGALISYGR